MLLKRAKRPQGERMSLFGNLLPGASVVFIGLESIVFNIMR